MTTKADFTETEWDAILHGPPTAGLIVLTAQRGGTFRETFAMAKAYTEARKQPGQSELVDEIVSTKPAVDHTRHHSPEELKATGLGQLRETIGLLTQKATSAEVDDYREFVLAVAERVAHAHREHGVDVSDAEQAALDEIKGALAGSTTA